MVEPLGVVEVDRHLRAERLVAVGHHVEQVADRHDVADFERVALIDQQLHHHLERRPLALQHAGDGDERLHEGRAERVDLAEHLPVALVRQQDVHHCLADRSRLLERRVELPFGRLALGLEHALLGDGRQVAVLQGDRVEPSLLLVERVAEVQLLGARHVVADQLAQVPLPGHEADDRDRPVGRLGLDQLGELGGFPLDEVEVSRVLRQPENQLVEKQDQRSRSPGRRVLADDGQPLDRNERSCRPDC